jgi:hypothetical protein
MEKRPTWSDVYDTNPKTGALRLGKNRLDDYATKYLSKRCKEALITPMPLPVNKILEDEGLTVEEVSLSRNLDVFGCCLLLDGDVSIYDAETDSYQCVHYPAGTILIDPDSEEMYGKGARRNTLIHEALHWEKDKKYFEILSLRYAEESKELYPIMCRHTGVFYEPSEKKKTKENEVKWLEWQAHRLAPRILMPASPFKEKALAFIESYKKEHPAESPSCDTLVEDLSKFFIVSRTSVKYRLLEVELGDVISEFPDYEDVYAFINKREEFVPITPAEAFGLLEQNESFKKWIQKDCFIFAEGYFVLASPKYVKKEKGEWHLTKAAKKNLSSCVINIHEHRYVDYKNACQDFDGFAILSRAIVDIDRRLVTFHPKYQSDLNLEPQEIYDAVKDHLEKDDRDEEDELRKMIVNSTITLCQCLCYLMEKRGWKYPRTFSEETHLHPDYYRRIKKNSYNKMGTAVLLAICVGLQLRLRLIEELFDKKSENKLRDNREPDRTYLRILEEWPRIPIQDFNSILQSKNLQPLGSKGKDDEE